MTVEEWLGKDNQLGIDIWHKKYRYQNETFDEWVNRVSGGDKEVKRIIMERKFLFGGRTLSNRGTGKHGSFSNCYSRGFVEDNLDDIMQANTDIATTFKAQGGQGISIQAKTQGMWYQSWTIPKRWYYPLHGDFQPHNRVHLSRRQS